MAGYKRVAHVVMSLSGTQPPSRAGKAVATGEGEKGGKGTPFQNMERQQQVRRDGSK